MFTVIPQSIKYTTALCLKKNNVNVKLTLLNFLMLKNTLVKKKNASHQLSFHQAAITDQT